MFRVFDFETMGGSNTRIKKLRTDHFTKTNKQHEERKHPTHQKVAGICGLFGRSIASMGNSEMVLELKEREINISTGVRCNSDDTSNDTSHDSIHSLIYGNHRSSHTRSLLKADPLRRLPLLATILFYTFMNLHTEAFTRTISVVHHTYPIADRSSSSFLLESSNTERSTVEEEDVDVTWLEDETASEGMSPETRETPSSRKSPWGSKYRIQESVIRAGQEKAIRNKQKRSSDLDRKRRTSVSNLSILQ